LPVASGAWHLSPEALPKLEFQPVTPDRWPDLERLFGPRGAFGGCWCMWWRVTRAEFEEGQGEGNRLSLKRIVNSGEIPGLLAYTGEQPVGWCSVAPREAFPVLQRSRVLKPVDGQRVWSVVCFFIAKPYRRSGLSVRLLQAAVKHARKHGARIVEGYPVESKRGELPDAFSAFTGSASIFREVGFEEVARRSENRPILRRYLK